jgi:hypothetical protein
VCDAAAGAAADFDHDVYFVEFNRAGADDIGSSAAAGTVGESSCRAGPDDVGHEADSDRAAGDGVAPGCGEFAGEAGA